MQQPTLVVPLNFNLLFILGNLGIKSITYESAATKRDESFFNQYFKAWTCHPKLTVSKFPWKQVPARHYDPDPSSRLQIPKSQRPILGKSKFLALTSKTSSSHVSSNHTSWQSSLISGNKLLRTPTCPSIFLKPCPNLDAEPPETSPLTLKLALAPISRYRHLNGSPELRPLPPLPPFTQPSPPLRTVCTVLLGLTETAPLDPQNNSPIS
jgi:hypothetical protein